MVVVNSLQDMVRSRFWVAVFSEFIGTFVLVLVACGSIMSVDGPLTANNTVLISLTFGFSVGTIAMCNCRASGGHVNPAITTGFFVTRRISLARFIFFVVAQTVGAICGAGLLKLLQYDGYVGNYGTPQLREGLAVWKGFGLEMSVTFVLVYTAFATADDLRKDTVNQGPLAVGLAVAMCHLWTLMLTGAGMNPARAFGPALMSSTWKDHWIYWAGPLAGAIIGAYLYDFVLAVNASTAKIFGFFSFDYDNSDYDKFGRISDRRGPYPQVVRY